MKKTGNIFTGCLVCAAIAGIFTLTSSSGLLAGPEKPELNAPAIAQASVTEAQAKKKALTRTGGGNVVKCELDYDDGRALYDVIVVNGAKRYDMDIDARTGNIYKFRERSIDRSDYGASMEKPAVSPAKAKQIALKRTGGGTVINCKLDRNDGKLVYEIEVVSGKTQYELEIDASTGGIIDFEQEYDG